MDWITNAQALISLIVGIFGLISAAVTAYFAVKKVIAANKGKSLKEIWALVMKIADAAMLEAEKSDLKGAAKKEKALAIINAGAKEAGIDITPFTEQLSEYIDNSVKFANTFKKEA